MLQLFQTFWSHRVMRASSWASVGSPLLHKLSCGTFAQYFYSSPRVHANPFHANVDSTGPSTSCQWLSPGLCYAIRSQRHNQILSSTYASTIRGWRPYLDQLTCISVCKMFPTTLMAKKCTTYSKEVANLPSPPLHYSDDGLCPRLQNASGPDKSLETD